MVDLELHERVPKESFYENLEYRRVLNKLAMRSWQNREKLWAMYHKDLLFFVNTTCIAEGTPVLTDRGRVAIEQVTSDDLVWDGQKWVQQDGPLCQGRRPVIFAYEVSLTHDHKVRTIHGWQDSSKRYDRTEVRLPESAPSRGHLQGHETGGSIAEKGTRTAVVYDLLNCGPKRCFTVFGCDGRPLLVHNCWLFEPRQESIIPFITYPFQDDALTRMKDSIGVCDVTLQKSRDLGATWMLLTLFFHQWRTRRRSVYGLVSRNADMVDRAGHDTDTLFWKLDFLHEHLPAWLQVPKRHLDRVKMTMSNTQTGSGIFGCSATGDVARGGRKRVFGLDELASFKPGDGYQAWASTQFVSDSRIAPSTPKGAAGIFYDINHTKSQSIEIIRLHWSQHPYRKIGRYCGNPEDEIIKYLDKGYVYPAKYPFKCDGKERSPYYDNECRRHPQPAKIAQELDIDFLESGYPFFSEQVIKAHRDKYALPHMSRWYLSADGVLCDPVLVPHQDGQLLVWANLNYDGNPHNDHDYTIGCDISTGKGGEGSTNSVASVKDNYLNEKVAEFAINNQPPHEFARTVVALRRWFTGPSGPAFCIWESNGPGQGFEKVLMALQPERVYYRRPVDKRHQKPTKTPGWWSGPKEKRVLLENYQAALANNTYINRSRVALDECRNYVYADGDRIEHNRAMAVDDPTEAKANHGDRVIADALSAFGSLKRLKFDPKVEQAMPKPPYGSMAWRMADDKRLDRLEKEEALVWD